MNDVDAALFAIYFSGFSAHAVEVDGVVYPTLEHAYHCVRYRDPAIVEEIRATRSPEMSWEISQKHKAARDQLTDEQKIELMTKLTRAKIMQHASVREALVQTGDARIVKRIIAGPPGDGFWDIADGQGRNEWGKIWMQLRNDIQRGLL